MSIWQTNWLTHTVMQKISLIKEWENIIQWKLKTFYVSTNLFHRTSYTSVTPTQRGIREFAAAKSEERKHYSNERFFQPTFWVLGKRNNIGPLSVGVLAFLQILLLDFTAEIQFNWNENKKSKGNITHLLNPGKGI